jgi:arsenical pump membrane protein
VVSHWITWVIIVLTTLGVIIRPLRVPEWLWAVGGACTLVLARSLGLADAARGVASGLDVYLFLFGMMLLAEIAKQQGLFAWLAGQAARLAKGSPHRLFTLIYVVGTVVTIFLSNDATAVVLTPAVATVVKAMRIRRPLPFLYICAFVANAASFVLPISNPANLVIYDGRMPPLHDWLATFALPSVLAIGATFAVLRFTQRSALTEPIDNPIATPKLSAGGRTAAYGILGTATVLLVASAARIPLGLPTCLGGVATTIAVVATTRSRVVPVLQSVSWGVLAFVAALFVIVAALEKTGVVTSMAGLFDEFVRERGAGAIWLSGVLVAVGCNFTNNLPAGIVIGNVLGTAHAHAVAGAVLVGVDLGPNFSITGSLATVLWLQALRREGHEVTAWAFLKLGVLVTTPALVLALAGVSLPR